MTKTSLEHAKNEAKEGKNDNLRNYYFHVKIKLSCFLTVSGRRSDFRQTSEIKIYFHSMESLSRNLLQKLRAAVVARQKSPCLLTERSWVLIPPDAGLFSLLFPISSARPSWRVQDY